MTKLSWQEELRRLRKEPRDIRKFRKTSEKHIESLRWQELLEHYRENRGLSERIPDFWQDLIEGLSEIANDLTNPVERSKVVFETGVIQEEQAHQSRDALASYDEAIRLSNHLDAIRRAREIQRDARNYDEVLHLYQLELDAVSDLEAQAVILREIGRTLLYDMNNPKGAETRLKLACDLNEEDEVSRILLQNALAMLDAEKKRAHQPDEARPQVATPAGLPVAAMAAAELAEPASGSPIDESMTAEGEGERLAAGTDEVIAATLSESMTSGITEGSAEEAVEVTADLPFMDAVEPPVEVTADLPFVDAVEPPVEVTADLPFVDVVEPPVEVTADLPLKDVVGPPVVVEAASPSDEALAGPPTEKMEAVLPPEEAERVSATEEMEAIQPPEEAESVFKTEEMEAIQPPEEVESVSKTEQMEAIQPPEEVESVSKTERMEAVAPPGKAEAAPPTDTSFDEGATQRMTAVGLESLAPGDISTDLLLAMAREKASQATAGGDESIAFYRKILEFEPTRLDAAWELAQRLGLRGEPWEQAQLLSRIASKTRSNSDKIRTLAALGKVHAEDLGDLDQAMEAYEQLFKLDAAHPEGLLFARSYHAERENWSTLAEIYEEALNVRRSHELPFDAATELAELYWQKIGDLKQAERYFKRLRLSDPRNQRMLAFYADYYRREGDYRRLLPTLQAMRSQETDPRVSLDLAFEMADISENKLEQPDRAIDVWKSIYRDRPELPEPAQALKRLYRSSQKFNALLEFLKGEAVRLGDENVEQKVGLLFEIADLYRDQLRMETMETNTLAEVLALDPTNDRATESLASFWARTRNWNNLVGLYLSRAEYEETPLAEAEWRRRVVDIWRDKLHSISHAIPELERIVELCPDDRDALEELRAIYGERDEPTPLVAVLERQADLYEGDEKVVVLREMADLARTRLGDEEKAVQAAERILEVTGGRDRQALAMLEEIYRERRRYEDVVRILDARRQIASTRDEEIEILLALGDVLAIQLGEIERGLEEYHQVLYLDPDSQPAIGRIVETDLKTERWDDLEELCGNRGEWERLLTLLGTAERGSTDPAVRVDLLGRMATVVARELADPRRAMECYEAILGIRPDDAITAQALIPYYEGAAEHEKLVAALAIVIHSKEGLPAAAIARRIAAVYETDLGDPQAATSWAGVAVRHACGDASARVELVRLGRESGQIEGVVDLLRDLSGTQNPDLQHELLLDAAGLCVSDLGESHRDLAAELYREVLELTSGDPKALLALDDLYTGAGQPHQLLEILRLRIAAAGEAADQVPLMLRMASVQAIQTSDLRGAIESYEQVLALDPVNPDALEQAKQLHARKGDWLRVVEMGQRQLDEVSDRSVVLFELGQVYQHKLGDPARAVEMYSELIEQFGSTDLGQRAVNSLESLMNADRRLAPRIAAILEPHYRVNQRWDQLAPVVERLAGASAERSVRLSFLWDLADIQENRLGNVALAYQTIGRIAREDLEDQHPWDEMERLAGQCQDWRGVVELYQEARASLPDLPEVQRRLARVLDTHLGRYEEAAASWEQIRAVDAADVEAMEALQRLYSALGRTDDLVSLLLQQAEACGNDEETKDLLYRICEILQDAGRPLESIEYYQRIFNLDETDTRAFEALRTLLDACEDWVRLETLLQIRLGVCAPDEATELRMQLGALKSSRLGDWSGAVDAYAEVLLEHPDENEATRALNDIVRELLGQADALDLRQRIYRILATVHESRGAWEEMVELEEMRLADPGLESERIEHHLAIAALLRDVPGRMEDALVHLSAAWQTDFANHQVRELVESLAEELSAHERLMSLYRQGLESAPSDPLLVLSFHRRLAQLADLWAGDAKVAIDHYRSVLESEPDDREALDALERLYEQMGDHPNLVEIRRMKADLLLGAERLELLWKNAELLEETLGQPQEAVEVLCQIHQESGPELKVLDALESLYTQLGLWFELVAVLLEKASLVEEEERLSLYHQTAALQEDKLLDREAAVDTYRMILAFDERDLGALVALERLFEALQSWEELAQVIHRQIPLSPITDVQNHLTLRLAGIHERYLDDRPTAIDLYRQVLDADPVNPKAIEALEQAMSLESCRPQALDVLVPVYEAGGRWADLARLLEAKLALTSNLDDRLSILARIRWVEEEKLDDLAAAFDAASRYYTESATDEARRDMERLARAGGIWVGLASTYTRVVDTLDIPSERLSVLLRLAEIFRDQVGEAGNAESCFRQALELDEGNIGALTALERLYEEQGNHAELLDILERRVESAVQAGDRSQALEVLHRIASIHEDRIEDRSRAATCWTRCLDLDPADEQANQSLDRLYRITGQWAELVELLHRQVALCTEPERIAELRYQIGWIYQSELSEPQTALDHFDEVLSIRWNHPLTVAALKSLISRRQDLGPALTERTASALDRVYRRAEMWGELVGVLDVRAESDDPERAADFLTDAARIGVDRLQDHGAAFARFLRVFSLTPEREEVWSELKALAIRIDRKEELSRVLLDHLKEDHRLGEVQRHSLALFVGDFLERDLGDYPQACEAVELALEIEPASPRALDTLERLYERLSRYDAMRELCQRKAGLAADGPTRVRMWLKAGRIGENLLGDRNGASASYRQVLDLEPGNTEAFTSFQRLLELDDRYEELVALYRDRVALSVSDEEQVRLLFQMGQTLRNDIGSFERAVPVFRNVLEIQPHHAGTVRAIEQLFESLKGKEAHAAVREDIAHLLEDIYRPEEDWQKLVAICEARLETASRDVEKAALLQKAAQLTERYGKDLRRAFEYFSRAFRLNPDDTECVTQLDRLVSHTGNYAAVVETLKEGFPRTKTRKLAIDLRLSTSEILEDRLIDPDAAIGVLEELLELDSHHPTALLRLEKLYRKTGRYENMVDILSRRVDRAADILERKDLLYEMAKIQEFELEDLDAAAETLRRILDLDPEDLVALDTLEVLLRKTRNYDDLANVLVAKADAVEDPAKRRAVQMELAQVYEHDLEDLYSAIDVYRNLQLDHPEDREAILALDRLYERGEKWSDLLDIITVERRLAQTDEELASLDFRSANLMQSTLKDVPRAIQMYKAILDRLPTYQPALKAVEDLLEGEHSLLSADVLEPIYLQWDQWEKVIHLMEHRLTHTEESGRRYILLREMARLYEVNLGQPTMAFRELSRALAEQPEDSSALGELERLTERFELWDTLAQILDQAASRTDNPGVRRNLLLKSANINRSRLDDVSAAILRFQNILKEQSHDLEALEALDELFQAEQNWDSLAEILTRRLEISTDPAQGADLRFRLGYLWETYFDEGDKARELYTGVLAAKPDHEGATEGLWRLAKEESMNGEVTPVLARSLEQREDWAGLVRLWELALSFETDVARRVRLYQQIAELFEVRLGDPRSAFDRVAQAARELPNEGDRFLKLRELAKEMGAWKELAAILAEISPKIAEPRLKTEVVRSLATLYQRELSIRGLAEERFQELLTLNPGDPQALEALENIYREGHDDSKLLEILEKRASTTRRFDERCQILLNMAKLAEHTLNDPERAAWAYHALLELTPSDEHAIDELIRLHGQLKAAEPLLDVLARKADITEDSAARAAIYCEMGVIAHDKLGDLKRAAQAFRMALNLDPGREELYQTLDGLYRSTEDWESLRQLLQGRIRSAGETDRLELIRRLALLIEERFDDTNGAIALYREALKLSPRWHTAHADLTRLLAMSEKWEELVAASRDYAQVLEEAPEVNREERVRLYLQTAEVKEKHLEDLVGARDDLRRLIELDPSNRQAIQHARDMAETAGEWNQALDYLVREIELVTDRAEKGRLLFHQGLLKQKAGAPPESVRVSWELAQQVAPQDIEIIRALKDLYVSLEDPQALWSAIMKLLPLETESGRQIALARDLIEVARTEFKDHQHLVDALEVAQATCPSDLEMAQELALAYIQTRAFNRAAPLIDQIMSRLGSSAKDRQLALLEHLKGLVAQGQGDEEGALKSFQRAYKADMNYLPNLMSLGKAQFNRGDLDDALKIFQTMLLHQMSLKSAEERVEIFYHLGEIMLRKNDRRRAREMFSRALSIDRNHQGAIKGLAQTQ